MNSEPPLLEASDIDDAGSRKRAVLTRLGLGALLLTVGGIAAWSQLRPQDAPAPPPTTNMAATTDTAPLPAPIEPSAIPEAEAPPAEESPPIIEQPAATAEEPAADSFNPDDAKVSDMQQRLQELEAKLEAANAHSAGSTLSGEAVRMLDEQLKSQSRDIALLKLEQRAAWRTVTLLTAYDRLKDAGTSGKPFMEELSRFRSSALEQHALLEPLKQLDAIAPFGMPRLESLKRDFAPGAKAALRADAPHNASFMEKIQANLSQLIIIRRVGEQPGEDPEAVIARAEAALARDDVRGTLKELSALPIERADAFDMWKNHAQAFLTTHSVLQQVHALILTPESKEKTDVPPTQTAPETLPAAEGGA